MRGLVGVVLGICLIVFGSKAASAATVTINDISDDFVFPYSYSSYGGHEDTVTVHVSGGNFIVEFILKPISGDFRALKLDVEDRISHENVLPTGKSFTTTLFSSDWNYDVSVFSRRRGGSGTITYQLVINTLEGGVADLDECEDVPVEVRTLSVGHMPIPGAGVLFASGVAVLGMASRFRRRRA